MTVIGGMLPAYVLICFWVYLAMGQTCPDKDNVTMPCALNYLPGLNCSYVKGFSPESPDGIVDFPGPVDNLAVDTVVNYKSVNSCETFLNITWKINPLGSPRSLRGFLLNMTFFYQGILRSIKRTFHLKVENWTRDFFDIIATTFRHECVIPATNTSYRIELQSLPISLLEKKNVAVIFYSTSQSFDPQAPCDNNPADPDRTYDWRATMTTSLSPSESSVEICFFTAPAVFRFTVYKVALINANDTSELRLTVDERYVFANDAKNRKLCQKFNNICSGIYKAWVHPMNEPKCVCRSGPHPENDCKETCYATEVGPLDMTASDCYKVTTIEPTTEPNTESTSLKPTALYSSNADPLDGAKIAGIVVGVIAAIVLITIVVLVFYVCICNTEHDSFSKKPELPDWQNTSIEKRQTVLIVYSSDSEYHRKVVRSFAAFLHSCCGCDIRYDEWSQVDIAQTSSIDWLTKQLHQIKHVVIINSLGGFMQHQGWIEREPYVPIADLLLPDMFVPAVRQIQTKFFLSSPQFHYYHVYFPYTEQKHLLKVSFGKPYKLMDHVEDLFLNIHGLHKFSSRGITSANQINPQNYMKCEEGLALRDAINEACEYFRDNPNWFQQYYKSEGNGVDQNEVIFRSGSFTYNKLDNDASTRPSSINSEQTAKDEMKTSDLGNISDIEYVPPSLNDSVSDDFGICSLSPDFGIGGMIDDSMYETLKIPICDQFSPAPPDDDDDTSSMGSRSFTAKVHELNEQFDSGFSSSTLEFRVNKSSC